MMDYHVNMNQLPHSASKVSEIFRYFVFLKFFVPEFTPKLSHPFGSVKLEYPLLIIYPAYYAGTVIRVVQQGNNEEMKQR